MASLAPRQDRDDSSERLRRFIETVPDYAIFMLDTEGRVVTWNNGAERLIGYPGGEIVGEHFRVFATAAAQARHQPERELELALRDGRYDDEGWRLRKDGSRLWANVVISPLTDERGVHCGFGVVTRDNTDRHAMNVERDRASRTLGEANRKLRKLADEKAEFVAIAAHELRGPVMLMRGSADTLLDDWDRLDDPNRKRLLELLAAGGNRLHRLLEDLLLVTRAEAGRLDLDVAPLQLRPLLTDTVDEVNGHSSIAIECDDTLVVDADRGRIVQVVSNLVGNALRYGAAPVAVSARAAGDTVEISVTDQGPGVPEADVPKLFTKFATMRRSAGGTGLGLYIVSQLAQAHGGSVAYERPPDGGSRFTVRLPASARTDRC
ncbi:MAG: PAS domain-containing sensor histidine kinase [Candidatus Dormibacteria bacterium]